MKDRELAHSYWEKKILKWERFRYSTIMLFYPFSWTVRYRLHASIKILKSKLNRDWSVCELGCGSGLLASKIAPFIKKYHGVDIASCAIDFANEKYQYQHVTFEAGDVLSSRFQFYDLYVFLGLTDWLEPDELKELLNRIETKNVFFSFTESRVLSPWNPYRIYRNFTDKEIRKNSYQALTYSEEDIRNYLASAGFKMTILKKASLFDPGVLVWGTK